MAREIKLSNSKKMAIVDDDVYDLIKKYSWRVDRHGYVKRVTRAGGRNHDIMLHKLIVNSETNEQIDHADRNTFNNLRSNLRACTRAQNQWNKNKPKNNTSGFKGVCWDKTKNMWVARIRILENRIFIGYFADTKTAAIAYDRMAKKHHGDFACTNFK